MFYPENRSDDTTPKTAKNPHISILATMATALLVIGLLTAGVGIGIMQDPITETGGQTTVTAGVVLLVAGVLVAALRSAVLALLDPTRQR